MRLEALVDEAEARVVLELAQARATIAQQALEGRAKDARLALLQADQESMTSLLVHDLRAPLASMRANLDWVKDELPKDFDAEVLEALAEARQVTDRLAGMIGDLLNISRLEGGLMPLARDAQPCAAMVEAVHRQLLAPAHDRRVTVECEVEDVVLEADHGLLMRALENLAGSALRYTPSGGRLRLEAKRVGPELVFAVRHDGSPISAEVRASLFEKYVQAGSTQDHRRAGWGLGLYFCKLCVDAHGGRLDVVDVEGWATSFEVRLPFNRVEEGER